MTRRRLPSQVGLKFGTLTVLEEIREDATLYVLVRCDCGNTLRRRHGDISGTRRNSTCYECARSAQRERGKKNRTHGHSRTKIYDVYRQMIRRCYEPKCKDYKNWGARGITVCYEWRTDVGAFIKWAHANGYKANVTIERKEVNGNYEPDNCTWIPNEEQANNRTDTVILEFNGLSMSVSDWSARLGIKYSTIKSRLRYGFPIERVLTP